MTTHLNSKKLYRWNTKGFSLVEVTIALGLVSYVLIALLGLFVVGLNSSRDSSRETALTQVALHARANYNPTNSTVLYYNNQGLNVPATDTANLYFKAECKPSTQSVANTSTDFQLLTIVVESLEGKKMTNEFQSSVFVQ